MHELSIATRLIAMAENEAETHGGHQVVRVEVAIGELAGVDPAALHFCLPIAARRTRCEGAVFAITSVAATGCCPSCSASVAVHAWLDACPGCGAWPLELRGGREMTLRSVEIH